MELVLGFTFALIQNNRSVELNKKYAHLYTICCYSIAFNSIKNQNRIYE